MDSASSPVIGIVVIGRNEGSRLERCLLSFTPWRSTIVYVDSGSTDGSPELACSLGAEVVSLDMSQPFTAARARNIGFERLAAMEPAVEFVQFVDGDCQVATGWLEAARTAMQQSSERAIVCGRRRELYPERSPYNLLCDMEWDTPIGSAEECGGDALIRTAAFRQVGGYNPRVIAGEEPEMCLRLRGQGWKVERIDAEMTRHDAAMTRFSQWWRRNVRGGHAMAEHAAMYGGSALRNCIKQCRSTLFWGCVAPLVWLLALLTVSATWPNLLLGGYLLLLVRIYRYRRRRGDAPAWARCYALFTVLGKFPQMQGMLTYAANRLRGRRAKIIEYKGPAGVATGANQLSRGCA